MIERAHVLCRGDAIDVGDLPERLAESAAGAPGEHTLVATAVDASGNEASTTITVTVPGAGGSGSGGGSATGDDTGADDLPGCSLDAGGGKSGLGMLALGLGLMLRRRRR